ncbi:hypothetical protein [Flavobacterium glaciei]|uniref:Uncharacterized protein n=1 Tax=Flavobacterium glaciei TaxID=386300 RepID=A0A562Q7Q2_9FLAO|nr:hypothetical protein [Flavobacterium glaciei]RDI58259.1 hypothetical protein DFR66_101185 [Flavobacterium glaciei]TWI52046.1 hypothetical protein IQ02_00183 [Flavobacterium glaciei]
MLQSIRNNKGLRLFCAFIALYLLNCSVDCSDITPPYIAEDLTINDQESIIEIVVEKVLGYENAIPENEDSDEENTGHFKKTISIAFYVIPHLVFNFNMIACISKSKRVLFCFENSGIAFFEIHSPPPEV